MSGPRPPTVRVTCDIPEYREVKEHGRYVIKLMRKCARITHYAGYYRYEFAELPAASFNIEVSRVDIAKEWVPPKTFGESWWEEA